MTVARLAKPTQPSSRKGRGALPSAPPPRPWIVDAAVLILGVGFGWTLALSITAESLSQLRAAGGLAMYLGNVTGLAGTYLALVMVVIVSRVPYVERVLGQDGLLRWHRRLAPWPVCLISAHVLLLTLAYAEAAHHGIWSEVGTLIRSFPDMLIATVGFLLMFSVAIISMRAIRDRIGRERWWAIHLFMYLALALSFADIIVLGPSFVGHPLTRIVWSVIWIATAGLVLCYRIGLPLARSLRHRLVVTEIRPEGRDVVSVICKGRQLDHLAVSGGQFFEWRFLVRGMWWQAHPFSLSARPNPPYLRITVKGVGDFSKAIAHLRPGTRVLIEGPYGTFTSHTRHRKKVGLIAGGIGVTAIRSLIEDMPIGSDPVVVVRASTEDDLVLAEEIAALVRQRKGRVHELVGSRTVVGIDRLIELVPDLKRRDLYVAGPEDFVRQVVAALEAFGVPRAAVHYEAYALP